MLETSDTIRAFICVNLPDTLRGRLAALQRDTKTLLPLKCVRWTNPEQIHLTLRFLGNIPRDVIEPLQRKLADACLQASPFHLRAAGLGCFPDSRRPRVLWIGIAGDLEALAQLQKRIVEATGAWGEAEPQETFHPHLTFARVKDARPREARRIREVLETPAAEQSGDWRAEQVALMESVLGPQGAHHSIVSVASLGTGG